MSCGSHVLWQHATLWCTDWRAQTAAQAGLLCPVLRCLHLELHILSHTLEDEKEEERGERGEGRGERGEGSNGLKMQGITVKFVHFSYTLLGSHALHCGQLPNQRRLTGVYLAPT